MDQDGPTKLLDALKILNVYVTVYRRRINEFISILH